MQWHKIGRICGNDSFNLPWHKKNTMVPVPHVRKDGSVRVFITMCDEHNIGRIGYVDIDPINPTRIIGYSKSPVIDIGEDGCFDDNGVVTSSILEDNGKLYLYYSGYQTCVKVPYLIFTGVAVSEDDGETFAKISKHVPMLDRANNEVSTRCAPFVIKENGIYKMWYTSDSKSGWLNEKGKKLPLYDLKYLTSTSPVAWNSEKPQVAITFQNTDEHGIAKCTIWKENSIFKIIYSIRSLSKGYRLGYGESFDGAAFIRKDSKVGIDVSSEGWDSEMIAFAERLQCGDRTYLFYCGNHYGMGGIGCAELKG